MRRGFTIVELLVAVAVLVGLLAASGVIFSMAVDAQRTASATGEITQKLHALTEQLDYDFAGLWDEAPNLMPMAIWFERDSVTGERFDQILFFADGNFTTTRQYDVGGIDQVLMGGGRIYYGHANSAEILRDAVTNDITGRTITDPADYRVYKTLARRQHVLAPILGLDIFPDTANFTTSFIPFDVPVVNAPVGNDYFEYDTLALVDWQNTFNYVDGGGIAVNSEQILGTCFDNADGRPGIDLKEPLSLHMLMCQCVGSFKIQWAYDVGGQVWWFPGANPVSGDTDFADILIDVDGDGGFGVYFNMPGGVDVDTSGIGGDDWATTAEIQAEYLNLDGLARPWMVAFPDALKFTFTLYDSRGIFRDGKTFTHIVYLD